MEHRSTVAVVFVVSLALLAGCSALVGDDGAAPESPDDFAYADGYDAGGVTDGDAAARSYRHALTNRSSYTVAYDQNVTGPDTDLRYDVEYRVDVESEQAYHSVDAPSLEYRLEEYYANDRKVERVVQSGDEQLSSVDSEFSLTQLTGIGAVDRLLNNETVYETSVGERDGTPVVVYETAGAANATTVFGVDEGNVTAFSASVAVDSEGIVRSVSYELETVGQNGEELTVTLDFEVRDLDATSIDRPEWADDA